VTTQQTVQITQNNLVEIYELRRELAQKKKRVEDLESYVKTLLIGKTPVEMGRFDASLLTRTMHHPAWKQTVIEAMGREYAESVWRNSKTSIHSTVVIEEHGTLPLWNAVMGDFESNG